MRMAIDCPAVVYDYNDHMNGVDVIDQMMEYYRLFFQTRKWTVQVTGHRLEMATVNSWLEYSFCCTTQIILRKMIWSFLTFSMELTELWLT